MMLLINKNIIAQSVVPSVSNLLRYGDGERMSGNINLEQKYFENLTDIRIALPESFTVGFRLLYDDTTKMIFICAQAILRLYLGEGSH
jgi:hypothetical protein